MAFQWAPIALLGIIGSLPLFLLAPMLYLAAPRNRRNVLYSLLITLQGIAALCGASLMYLTTEPATAFAFQFITNWLIAVSIALLLVFAGTLDSPLSRPFRSWWGVAPLTLATAAFCAYALQEPSIIIGGVRPASYAPWDGVGTPITAAIFIFGPLIYVYLILVGVSAMRGAPRASAARAHARALAWAFGIRGICLAIAMPMLVFGSTDGTTIWALIVLEVGVVAQAAVLTHGIVKTQLFDVELKIKWTIRKGTLAAAFVGVFFVVSEGAQTLLSAQMGPVAGLLAAGALVFAIAPLQRFADGLADRAMPRVQDTEEYRLVRKREVYRAAVETALEEGGDITPKERGMLATLQDQLDIGAKDAHDIERAARAARTEVAT